MKAPETGPFLFLDVAGPVVSLDSLEGLVELLLPRDDDREAACGLVAGMVPGAAADDGLPEFEEVR